ncbi:Uncharacterised protein [Neisseria meningitidis]|uniref:hypothetical protein n=1 Tax=Neisseria meningitidis TaxID=487 RepID=UPI0005DD24AA|nr:hypothetical protein [Neisseria meningitidis]CKK84385.1 Uncharacterised protein [Neisseria meningitidis]
MVFPRLAAVGGAVPDVRRHIFGEIDFIVDYKNQYGVASPCTKTSTALPRLAYYLYCLSFVALS